MIFKIFREFTSKLVLKSKFKHQYKYYINLKAKYDGIVTISNVELQKKKMNLALENAINNVPYYKKLLIELDGNETDLSKFPVLTKALIRSAKSDLLHINSDEIKHNIATSGGSTGEPISIYKPIETGIVSQANYHLVNSWHGVEPYHKYLKLWGADRDTYIGKKPVRSRIIEFISNYRMVNSFNLDKQLIKEVLTELESGDYKMLAGYAQSLDLIANEVLRENIKIKPGIPIHSAASTLTDVMRKNIEKAFKTRVFDFYGSREVGAIAAQNTSYDKMQVLLDNVVLEIVNDDLEPCKKGESGKILITTLNNKLMPLIRYEIGDIAISTDNDTIKTEFGRVKGRTVDIFKTKSGKQIDGEFFTHLFYYKPNIKKFQVVQERIDLININIVGEISKLVQNDISEKIRKVMGEDVLVEFSFVDIIPKTKTGKFLYTISKI